MDEWHYEFSVWPREDAWEQPIYETFRFYPRISMTFTEAGWATYSASMERSGFTLREVERWREVDRTAVH